MYRDYKYKRKGILCMTGVVSALWDAPVWFTLKQNLQTCKWLKDRLLHLVPQNTEIGESKIIGTEFAAKSHKIKTITGLK